MKTNTIIKILKEYQELVKDKNTNGLEEMNDENSFSAFIMFKGIENYLEIVITAKSSFVPLETDSGTVYIEEIYTQENTTYENGYFIDSESVRLISNTDY